MTLRFVDCVKVVSAAELSPEHRAQLECSGQLYDGRALPADARLISEEEDDEDESFVGRCTRWRVVDGDRHVIDAWFYMTDSGSMFEAGTTNHVASIIQFGLECEDPELRRELGMAMVEAKLLNSSDGSYARYAAMLRGEPVAPDDL